jgi:hypothetical protein
MATFNLTQEEYEALIALARRGTRSHDGRIDQSAALQLESFLRQIEKENGVTRYALWIQWQDPTAPLPPGVRFPETWPPNLRYYLELLTRPIMQSDVEQVVNTRTPNATNIMVTRDPAALLGWTPLAQFFIGPDTGA